MAVGRRVRPDSWRERTAGQARYTTDLRLPGMLTARVLRSPHPHAEIKRIDTATARALPHVEAILTGEDLPNRLYQHLGPPFSDRRALARERVRFVGEEVAAVAAATRPAADAAVAAIAVEYRVLPAATTPTTATAPRSPTLHDHAPGNVALHVERSYGDPPAAGTNTDVEVTGIYRYRPATHLCMEPHAVLARWDDGRERLDLWVSTQAPYFVRKEVAHLLDLDLDQVHTHEVAVGGGFGAKAKAGTHETIAAALAMRTGRPVRLVLDRTEEFATTATRHPFDVELTTGARDDGTLTHRRGRIVVDNGAYNHAGPSVAVFATMLAAGHYRLEASQTTADLVYTNRQPAASFRGYGNPQINFAMESQLDELAAELGIDRLDLRLRNAHGVGEETLTGWRLHSAGLVECLERARDEIGWNAKQSWAGTGRGVGIAAAVHVSGANAFEHSELSGAALDVLADGTVEIRFAGADAGTGQATLLRQIAAEELGVDFDDTSVSMMESDGTPLDLGAWSSRGTVWSGHAMVDAAGRAAAAIRATAADKFSAAVDQIELVDGQARCGDDVIDIGELVVLADGAVDGRLSVEGEYRTDVEKMDRVAGRSHFSPSYCFAAQAVEVEVDPDTGRVEVVDVVSVHDSGTALNPAAAEGQIVGAVTMGLGAALGEELIYEDGRLVNPSYLEYPAPRAADVPPIRPILLDGRDPAGPYGAKGLGEIGLVPTPAAVANAVAHATGVRVRELPITPDKLLPHLRTPVPMRSVLRRPSRWWTELVRRAYPLGLFSLLHRYGTRFARRTEPRAVTDLERPTTISAATQWHDSDSAYIGGGTDLLVARDQGLDAPARFIDLSVVRELSTIEESDDGIEIGGGVRLEDLRRYLVRSGPGDTMLHDLLGALATPQIREMATVAGNLLQEKRCSYFRNGFSCFKRAGWTAPCHALHGEHRFHHAVVAAHRCQAVTPSDLSTGLAALDAVVRLESGDGDSRTVPVLDLYTGPGESVLTDGELLTAIAIPGPARRRGAAFEKLRMYSGDFAVCAAAVSVELEDGAVTDARVVLGSVAPVPHRAAPTETALAGLRLDDEDGLRRAAEAWAVDAHPLAGNRWKVDAACGLIRRALARIRRAQ